MFVTAEEIYADKLLTTHEAAKVLGVSIDAVGAWLRDPEKKAKVFPHAYKKGPTRRSAWRIPMADIEAFMEAQTGLPAGGALRGNDADTDEEE